jgi:hypothetical protein
MKVKTMALMIQKLRLRKIDGVWSAQWNIGMNVDFGLATND